MLHIAQAVPSGGWEGEEEGKGGSVQSLPEHAAAGGVRMCRQQVRPRVLVGHNDLCATLLVSQESSRRRTSWQSPSPHTRVQSSTG